MGSSWLSLRVSVGTVAKIKMPERKAESIYHQKYKRSEAAGARVY